MAGKCLLFAILSAFASVRVCAGGEAVGAPSGSTLFGEGGFFIGCNYWAAHAGMYMWRDWRPDLVDREVARLSENGIRVLRVFPLWNDFQPLTRVRGCHNVHVVFRQNDGPLENEAGVDGRMMRRFRDFCDIARKHDVRLIVGLVTGWMSGRMFVPPALDACNVLTDPEALMWTSRFVRHFVTEMRDHPAIAAWDYGNECNCMGDATMAEFYNWMNVVGMTIRLADPSRDVVSGLDASSTKMSVKVPIRHVSELADVQCTHPYSFYRPGGALDPLGTLRPTLHPSAESLLTRDIGGKPCFIEELGGIGTSCNSEERTAAAMRATMFCAWANDLKGFLWWCNADHEHLRFPPYDLTAYERELGMMRADGTPKPVLREMKAFGEFLASLPFGRLPARRTDSVIVVPEMTDGWLPAFGAYLLARQAGLDPLFAGGEHDLPDSSLYIVCSSERDDEDFESYTSEAEGRILERAKRGATVLWLYSSQSKLAHLREEAGLVADYATKAPVERIFSLAAFPGRTMTCRDAWTTRLAEAGCEVLGRSADGEPVFTRFRNGKGQVLVCNSPIDREAVARTDVLAGEGVQPYRLVLAEAKRLAGLRRVVEKLDSPSVVLTEHPAEGGSTIVVAVNCDTKPAVCRIDMKGAPGTVWRGKVSERVIELPPDEAAVFEVRGGK